MGELIAAIQEYLSPIFTADPYNYGNVIVGNSRELATLITGQAGNIVIEPGREYQTDGPAGGQVTRRCAVTIRIVVTASDYAPWRDQNNAWNIYGTIRAIRAVLAQNKSLGTINDVLPRFKCDFLGEATEVATGRTLEMWLRTQYSFVERWDGAFNNQPNLEPLTA